jgi:HEAT repeat protein
MTRAEVTSFEEGLRARPETDRPAELRGFARRLGSSEARLAFIETMDQRYASLVAPELHAELLGPLLRDDDPRVRARTARAMSYLDARHGQGEADRLLTRRFEAELLELARTATDEALLVDLLRALRPTNNARFFDAMLPHLKHPSATVRATAVFELCHAGAACLEPGAALLDDPVPAVRSAAVQSLTAHSLAPEMGARVAAKLDDGDRGVREATLKGLAGMRDAARFADRIAARTKDPEPHVRAAAATAIGALGLRQHGDALVRLLADADVVVRRYAVDAVGTLGDRRHLAAVRRLEKDADEQVRTKAAAAAGALTKPVQR